MPPEALLLPEQTEQPVAVAPVQVAADSPEYPAVAAVQGAVEINRVRLGGRAMPQQEEMAETQLILYLPIPIMLPDPAAVVVVDTLAAAAVEQPDTTVVVAVQVVPVAVVPITSGVLPTAFLQLAELPEMAV